MRAAPAFEIDLPLGRRERLLVVLLYAASAAVLAWWLLASVEADPALYRPLALAAAALGGAAAGARAGRLPGGQLRWDGRLWSWRRTPGETYRLLIGVRPMIDLGGWLLLRVDGPVPGAWLVASRRAGRPDWPALRLALFAAPEDAREALRTS